MFDKSFRRSEVYFTYLQLLRIFDLWIRKLSPSLKKLRQDMPEFLSEDDVDPDGDHIRGREELWENVFEQATEAETNLLKRIAVKAEELKSLRDGVSHPPNTPRYLNVAG
jgi:hypothetical protein